MRSAGSQPAQEKWRLLPEFLKVRGLVKQHIDSFNYFVNVEMKKIVAAAANCEIRSEINRNFFLQYENVYIGSPTVEQDTITSPITPHECRLRDITYAAPIYVDVRYTKGCSIFKKKRMEIGRIPIMLHSCKCVLDGKGEAQLEKLSECPYDPGGYFIVKGSEKVILIQEQLSKNRIILELDSKQNVCASVTSSTHERKSRTAIYVKKDKVYLKHNSLADEIPILIVLKAMGVTSDHQILSMIGPLNDPQITRFLTASFEDAAMAGVVTTAQALEYIGQRVRGRMKNTKQKKPAGAGGVGGIAKSSTRTRADDARDLLANVVLNHVPVEKHDLTHKRFYIAYMVRLCLQAQVDHSLLDDKDYYGNKRLELAGQLLALLFEDLFKRFNTELKSQTERVLAKPNQAEAFDIMKHMKQSTITNGFVHAISTGNWTVKRFKMDRAGVTQQLSRLSYMSAIGHMTRITSQFEKTRKVSGPRALQPSQWGMLCPSDTPEGESCGLVKNLALLTHVTSDEEIEPIKDIVMMLGVQETSMLSGEEIFHPDSYIVMLNGLILGVHSQPLKLADQLRKLRRAGRLREFVSVFVNSVKRTVLIASDGGRVCRPLILIDRKKCQGRIRERDLQRLIKGKMSFHDLLRRGLIEYIDVNESNNTLVALKEEEICPEHTHLEIDPLTILGVVAGLVPYPHHNQSPRNTYQCAMGKQAIGTIGMNQLNRIDTLLYLMVYPHKPMVRSRTLDLVNFDDVPAGQNAIVAVMSYSGYDIEDAVILNKASLDRGYGRCIVLKKFNTVKRRYTNNTSDQIQPPAARPGIVKGHRRDDGLEQDGIVGKGVKVRSGDVLVNRAIPMNTSDLVDNPRCSSFRL